MALDVVEDAEVDRARAAAATRRSISSIVRSHGVEVDLGRRRRCEDEPARARSGPRPRRRCRASRPRGGTRPDAQAWPGAGKHARPTTRVADDADVLLGHGRELAPELVERIAVQPPRARLEPARVDEVRRADLRDVHRAAPDARARAPRRRRRGRGGCGRGAGARTSPSSTPRAPSASWSAGRQLVGPQSKSARPSSVSTRYAAMRRGSPQWRRSSGSGVMLETRISG